MIPAYVALTTLTDRVRLEELMTVGSALQTQVTRDFAPEWGRQAIVAAVPFDSVPAGFIPMIVRDPPNDPAANGFHRTHDDDTPYVAIPYGPNWSQTASHMLLRLLADPTASARIPGPSRMTGQGTVEYCLDVCGPCQDPGTAYAIDGVAVSDFCTRAFFSGGGRCSFSGVLGKPFEPGNNGLTSWLADDGLFYQARADRRGRVRVLGGFAPAGRGRMPIGQLVDMLTPDRFQTLSDARPTARIAEAAANARRARFTNAMRFRDDIASRFAEPHPPLRVIAKPVFDPPMVTEETR